MGVPSRKMKLLGYKMKFTPPTTLPQYLVFRWLNAASNNMSGESFQGKKLLVTGGGGYFGHKLGNALKKKGAELLAFDISWPLDKTAYKQLECVQVRSTGGACFLGLRKN